jgi:hypothetical protein
MAMPNIRRLCSYAVVAVVALPGCSSKSDDYGLPPGGSGGGGGATVDSGTGGSITFDAHIDSTMAGDAAVQPIDAGVIPGRVCLAADPQNTLISCASAGAGGLTVRLGSAVTLTNPDGTFELAGPPGDTWVVTGASIVTSLHPYGDYYIPALTHTTFEALAAQNNVTLLPAGFGYGSIMGTIVRNGHGASNLAASILPIPNTSIYQAFYDSAAPGAWTQTSTGSLGAYWIPGVQEGIQTLAVVPTAPEYRYPAIPVADTAITFITVALGP